MAARLSIGDFSRMTHLSVKALRHYHDSGLLAPAAVDPQSGYRFYAPAQVALAQAIRRFRELGMPIETVKAVLAAPGIAARNTLIARHLAHMESELERTRSTVASLRALLEASPGAVAVSYRSIPERTVAAIVGTVELSALGPWMSRSFAMLREALREQAIAAAGPPGGVYPTTLYTDEVAEIVLFVPIAQPLRAGGEVRTIALPAVDVAVAEHAGPLREADCTYAPLGGHVTARGLGTDGPIREHYLVADAADERDLRTEICWPILRRP